MPTNNAYGGNNQVQGNTATSFGPTPNMTATQGSFFSQNWNRNGDGLEILSVDQLKERLIVAETIMKKLYNRNKELEDYHIAN